MQPWTSSWSPRDPQSLPAEPASTSERRWSISECLLRSNRASARDWRSPTTSSAALAHARLRELDPRAAAIVHPNDRRRVVRALELAESGSSLIPQEDRLWSEEYRRPTVIVGLDVSSEELDTRIRRRTEEMFARGVVDEVRNALEGRISRTAEKALGLSELARLSPDEALERIVVRTRRYAAYQRKWMRRIPGIVMIDGDRTSTEVADAILEVAGAR